jgi:hypothetical protein
MGGRSRQRIFGDRVRGARIGAQHAREAASKAIREADAAECLLWSEQMEGFGGPAQPSPTIAQCLNGGYGWLEVMCHRCEARASLPLDAIRRPRDTPIWKLEAALKCRSCKTPRYAPRCTWSGLRRSGRSPLTPGFIRTMIDETTQSGR